MKKMEQIDKASLARQEEEDFEREAQRWKEFGEWMKDQRETLKMTQLDAARKAGMARVTWARIELGDGTKFVTIPRIARALGFTTRDQIDDVLAHAGFITKRKPVQLPASMRHFLDLPIEIQQEIARQVEREYERLQLKKEKRARK